MSLWHHPPMNHLHLVTLSWVRYCTCFKPDLLHNKQVQTGGHCSAWLSPLMYDCGMCVYRADRL